jgi:hypothetical protein
VENVILAKRVASLQDLQHDVNRPTSMRPLNGSRNRHLTGIDEVDLSRVLPLLHNDLIGLVPMQGRCPRDMLNRLVLDVVEQGKAFEKIEILLNPRLLL